MKTSRWMKSGAALVLASVLAIQSGCVIAAVGAAAAGTVAYVRGDLQATLDAGYDRALSATRDGLLRMKYSLVSERSDAITGEFIARTALDKRVEVTVTKGADRSTRIRIRVGVFGDEEISRALLDQIKAAL